MSTKNLARTVIEGGRRHQSKLERRYSNAAERSHAHQLQRALCWQRDPEAALFEPRQPVVRGFSDKLGPAERWLRSQVGRPWDKVRSELFARFDARTTAGRHVLFDHLLPTVVPRSQRRRGEFWVSSHGILRYGEPSPKRSQRESIHAHHHQR